MPDWIKKHYLFFLFVLSPILLSATDLVTYYSPGFQLGYSKDQGYFISCQLSIGAGYRDTPIFPGVTLGIRRYRRMTMYYADAQLLLFFMGLGKGYAIIRPGRGYRGLIKPSRYAHIKFWGGAGFNLTYDHIRGSDSTHFSNHGLIMVSPRIITGKSYYDYSDKNNSGWN